MADGRTSHSIGLVAVRLPGIRGVLVAGRTVITLHRPALSTHSAPRVARVAVTEFAVPTPSAEPFDLTLGPDGALWFVLQDGTIGQITRQGDVARVASVAAGSASVGIETGPSGTIWITELGADRIGRISILPGR